MGRYRIREKPLKFIEKGNLEVLLFNLQSKMRAHYKVAMKLKAENCHEIVRINVLWLW